MTTCEATEEPSWFLLYDGSSPDGRGEPTFIGRTKDRSVARALLLKHVRDPYWTGHVVEVTDSKTTYIRIGREL